MYPQRIGWWLFSNCGNLTALFLWFLNHVFTYISSLQLQLKQSFKMKKTFFGLLLLSITACKPFDVPENGQGVDQSVDVKNKTMSQLVIPEGFTFETTKGTSVSIEARDNSGAVLSNITFNLFIKDKDSPDSVFLMTARTNTEGVFTAKLDLESTAERLIATTSYIGLPSYQAIHIGSSSNLKLSFGNDNTVRDGLVNGIEPSGNEGGGSSQGGSGGGLSPDGATFTYMGTYTGVGVPKYLETKGDVVSQSVLNIINTSLPESRPVPKYNPQYITTSAQTNIVLKAEADVWVTFVHEMADYKNSLGYYTYPTNNPPKTAAAISKMNIVFPNCSFPGSGGALKTGDKVKLGHFAAGTTVAWFLVPDGWEGKNNKWVTDTRHPIRYSDRILNTFTTEAYRSHTVLLNDPVSKLLILGFEDLDRPAGDNDFNDAIFYATVSPYTAINATNVPAAQKIVVDTDGDGVPDTEDAAPLDPTYAYVQFIPSATTFGSVAFEDSYPVQGDYDMNDMVIDYQYEIRTNGSNKVTALRPKFILRAMGAGYKNGFGFELPVTFDKISSVTGSNLKENLVTVNSNGTEARQKNAAIIAFDNGFNLMRALTGGFVNTLKDKPLVKPDTIKMVISFGTPVAVADLGTAPYNPFIFANHIRSNEIHLAGNKPTSLANLTLFGKGDDDSGKGKYYQTKNNLPWAILLPISFAYPIEKEPINKAYLNFNQWAESKGISFPDWYKPTQNNINKIKIF